MKPALLVLGGITYKNYAVGDLVGLPECSNYINREGTLDTKYAIIKELDCEQFLDHKIIDLIGRLFILGMPFRFWDRFGDYFKIISSDKLMRKCVEYIQAEVHKAQILYGEVDVIAHSLGTLIVATSNIKVNNLYLVGSPLTSQYWSVRHTANKFIQKNGLNAEANNIYYCYSPLDIVCTKPSEAELLNINCYPCSHNFSDYAKHLINKGIVKV
jgi:hypothetical protein